MTNVEGWLQSDWGPGPWQSEPDRVDWVHAGYACFVLRHPTFGSWCGYVGIDRAHPLYGADWTKDERVGELRAHRGINYSDKCDGLICHVPEPGMPDDVWWFGFDCHHSFDFSPALAMRELKRGMTDFRGAEHGPFREVYRDLAYVRAQTNQLAESLRALAG